MPSINLTMNDDVALVTQSLGRNIAGKFMLFFGAAMQLLAAFGYIIALVAGIVWVIADGGIISLLVPAAISIVLHASGMVMIYTGNYMLGRSDGLRNEILIRTCSLRVARDVGHAAAAMLFLLSATALAEGDVIPMAVMVLLFMGICWGVWQVNKLLKAMSQHAD